MDLRLCDGHHRGWPEVESDAYRRRVQSGVSCARGGALDHRRGRAQHPESRLFMQRGEPDYIRSDNGPEFIAKALRKWLAASGVKTLYIEPGAPWENAYSETFISRLRDELLNREMFANLKEAKVLAEDYRDHYNHHRPHGALGYLTPAAFTAIEALSGQTSGPTEDSEELESVPRLSL